MVGVKSFSILEALKWGSQMLPDSSRLDVEVLLAYCLNVPRAYLSAHQEESLPHPVVDDFMEYCHRRKEGEPIAYIIGYKEFWSLELEVNQDTLIPRPETERLVEVALDKLSKEPLRIVDLGVGSGAVAIALGIERPAWEIVATDISEKALLVANRNVLKHQVKNITLIYSDWYTNLPPSQFDAIVSNPPYIAEGDIHLSALRYEPKNALISGTDGLTAIRSIIQQAGKFLKKDGLLLLEHGYNQALAVRSLLQQACFSNIESFLDIQGWERVTGGNFKGE